MFIYIFLGLRAFPLVVFGSEVICDDQKYFEGSDNNNILTGPSGIMCATNSIN